MGIAAVIHFINFVCFLTSQGDVFTFAVKKILQWHPFLAFYVNGWAAFYLDS